jgi:hypothetical protein
MIHKKVMFKGKVYWLHKEDDVLFHYNISPLEHYNNSGDLLVSLLDVSYAVMFGEDIMRYGEVIGHKSDLKDLIGD